MKVILLRDIPKVGKKYDIKDVADGFALNLLIPQGKAEVATTEAIRKTKILQSRELGEKAMQEELLAQNIKGLDGKDITFQEKTSDKGHLFKGIHKQELVKAIHDQLRIDINSDFIELDKPIKEVGEYNIKISGHGNNAVFIAKIQALQ